MTKDYYPVERGFVHLFKRACRQLTGELVVLEMLDDITT